MSFWDDITGKTAAKKAESKYAEARAQQENANNVLNSNYARLLGASSKVGNQLETLIAALYPQMKNDISMSNAANQSALDILMSKDQTPEQQLALQLTQNYIQQLTDPSKKSAEQQTADQWGQKYLGLLSNSPDTAFNSGVTSLVRSLQNQKQDVANAMQQRGIAGSGIDLDKIAGTQSGYYKGVNQLQGQRLNRQMQNVQLGAGFAQEVADRQKQDYAAGANAADIIGQRQANNAVTAAQLSNSNRQNTVGTIGSLYSGLMNAYNMPSGAANGVAGQYNGMAGSAEAMGNGYTQQSQGAAGGFGSLVGTLLTPVLGVAGGQVAGGLFGKAASNKNRAR